MMNPHKNSYRLIKTSKLMSTSLPAEAYGTIRRANAGMNRHDFYDHKSGSSSSRDVRSVQWDEQERFSRHVCGLFN